ncbi:MAG TPA: helix-turn-helix domain-containing protein [Longimicrobiales bacterium]
MPDVDAGGMRNRRWRWALRPPPPKAWYMRSVYCVMPPYDEVREITFRCVSAVERGGIIVVDIPAPGVMDHERFRRLIHALRRRSNATIAIRLSAEVATAALRIAMHAYRCGVRAVLVRGEPLRPALWSYLTDPIDIPEDLIAWLRLRRSVSENVAGMIARIVRDAPRHGDFADLLDHLDVRARTLRHQLELESLPAPSKWYHLGRLLDAQLRLLRDPVLDTTRVAHELGYADRMSFTNRIYRLFGVTAERSRQLLGWEWRFAAWWERVKRQRYPVRQKHAAADFDFGSPVPHTS